MPKRLSRGLTGSVSKRALDLLALFAFRALVDAWLVRRGFSHVSDDDYARVVIAQLFAHAPKLDPSGTSWLPFPFWMTGGAMLAFGRSLAVARAVALTLGVASIAPVYFALRNLGLARATAIAAVVVATATPWSAWTADAMVPEGFAAALIAAGALSLGKGGNRTLGALALLAASLSRYEAWPVCLVFAAACARDAIGGSRVRNVALAFVAVAGPLGWMAWNAHAHGSALHFVARVTAYRQSIGAADIPLQEKLLGFPRALCDGAPWIVLLAALALPALRDRAQRQRWLVPLAATAGMLLFLVVGDVRDGAPTHHPERAIIAAWWVLAPFGVDGVRAIAARFAWARPKREMFFVGAAAAFAIVFSADTFTEWDDHPGRGASEDRAAQLARGAALRDNGASRFSVTPCAYEHFALLSAYEAPERATTHAASHRPLDTSCPDVVVARE